MRRARGGDGAQAIEAPARANADPRRERIEIAERIQQQANAFERIAREELLAQTRAENSANLRGRRRAMLEPRPLVEAIGVAARAAMDGVELHRADGEDRGDGLREAIETKPALIDVAPAGACRGEKKLHRPDEQQYRPSDEALEAMLAYWGSDDIHAVSLRPLWRCRIDWLESARIPQFCWFPVWDSDGFILATPQASGIVIPRG